MKNRLYHCAVIGSLATALLVGTSSCDKGFEEVNTNPVQPSSLNPVYLFSNAQLASGFPSHTINYEMAIVQQLMSPFAGVLAGGNINILNADQALGLWNQYYNEVVKRLVDVINTTKNLPERSNLYQMARIWHCHTFLVLSDTYGDVPYHEAGLGYLTGNFFPTYDAQSDIYQSILTTLSEASEGLNASGTIETGDLFYRGDISKWKKLANSLTLRAAMRLVKVDPAKAQEFAVKAINGGLMTGNADNCLMTFSTTFNSPYNGYTNGSEKANVYLSKPFVDHLKSTNDPRLRSISVKYGNPGADPSATTQNTTPADQIGMPYGYDNLTLATAPGFPGPAASGYAYSQINRSTIGHITAPIFFVTHAQTALLHAEAIVRGWVPGDAEATYKSAVKSALEQMAMHHPDAGIPSADVTAYVGAQTLTAGKELEEINTQYWVNSFLNGPEAWANFRRSGYPLLTPNPYPGKSIKGDFINRLVYPIVEANVNTDNYRAAVSRAGADDLDTKVWWDK
jgi:hypothetical protein